MSNDRTLRDLAAAGSAWRTAERAEIDRRALRDEAIRAANAAGIGGTEIARAVGMDRNAVHRIIAGKRGAQAQRRAAQAIRPTR